MITLIRKFFHIFRIHWWLRSPDDKDVKDFRVCRLCSLRKFNIHRGNGQWEKVNNYWLLEKDGKRNLKELDPWNLNK